MSQASHDQPMQEKITQLERQVELLRQRSPDNESFLVDESESCSDQRTHPASAADVALSALEHLVAVASTAIGDQFFDTLVEHLAKAFDVRYALVSELAGEHADRLRTLGIWADGQQGEHKEYDYANSPCELVIERGKYFCGSGVMDLFPEDDELAAMGVTSYCGVRFSGRDGKPLGQICILDTKPLEETQQLRSLLKLFGERAAQELQRKRSEDPLRTHNEVLQQIVHGKPLAQMLETIVGAIERQLPEAKASILLLEGSQLRHGAAPSLSDEYNQLVDGLEIGPETGSCGTAAFQKQRVVVEDILVDSRWAQFRELAARFGLRSCWSQPILTEGGNVLGTFALYHTNPRTPSEGELATVEVFASLAAVAIESKRTEEALKLRDAELAHVGRLAMLGEAVAELTHEINQPLYTITNFARACINETTKPDGFNAQNLQSWLGRIQDSCNRASDILRRTTEFVRRDDQERATVDVNQLISQTLELIAWRISRDQIQIEYQPPLIAIECTVNRVQLEQVLLNILVNACDAIGQAGGSGGRLTLSVQSRRDALDIVVEDNGAGISEEVRDTLFDPFITTKPTGMGLGLAISRSIVEDHGGEIWASDAPTGGTRFHVSLPILQTNTEN